MRGSNYLLLLLLTTTSSALPCERAVSGKHPFDSPLLFWGKICGITPSAITSTPVAAQYSQINRQTPTPLCTASNWQTETRPAHTQKTAGRTGEAGALLAHQKWH